MRPSSVVDQFVANWSTEKSSWEVLTKTAFNICKEGLKDRMKLKCHITYRTKEQDSLRKKLYEQEKERVEDARKGHYRTREEIEADMIDLAGVRVLLPFPDDVEDVKAFLQQEFGEDNIKTRFKGLDENGQAVERSDNRFLGYRATHFLVTWKKPTGYDCAIKTTDIHNGKTVEVQVTTILMNGWQEAQHDITYKQLSGRPSDDERALLEIINGLVHSGEIALRQLQRTQKRRILEGVRPFQAVNELTVWLRDWIEDMFPLTNSFRIPTFTHVGILFILIDIKRLGLPSKLEASLRSGPATRNTSKASRDDLLSLVRNIWPFRQLEAENPFALWDISLFAIVKIGWQDSLRTSDFDARFSAFIIVGAISMTFANLSWTFLAAEYGSALRQHGVDDEARTMMETALYSVMAYPFTTQSEEQLVKRMWEILTSDDTYRAWQPLLKASAALLESRVLLFPQAAIKRIGWRKLIGWPGELAGSNAYLWCKLPEDFLIKANYTYSFCDDDQDNCDPRFWPSEVCQNCYMDPWVACQMRDSDFINGGASIGCQDIRAVWEHVCSEC